MDQIKLRLDRMWLMLDRIRYNTWQFDDHVFPNLRVGDKVWIKGDKKPKQVKIIDYGPNGNLHHCLFYKYKGCTYYLSRDNFLGCNEKEVMKEWELNKELNSL